MKYALISLCCFFFLFAPSCHKKDNDYRQNYVGNYYFTSFMHAFHDTTPETFDTVRNYPGYITFGNYKNSILIHFLPDSLPYGTWDVELHTDGSIHSSGTGLGGALLGKFASSDVVNFDVGVGPTSYAVSGRKTSLKK
jgi:hypothetical protein